MDALGDTWDTWAGMDFRASKEQCEEATKAVALKLQGQGYAPSFLGAAWWPKPWVDDSKNHYAVVLGGMVIDPTAQQFNEEPDILPIDQWLENLRARLSETFPVGTLARWVVGSKGDAENLAAAGLSYFYYETKGIGKPITDYDPALVDAARQRWHAENPRGVKIASKPTTKLPLRPVPGAAKE